MRPTINFLNNFKKNCTQFSFFESVIYQNLSISFKFLFILILIISVIVGVKHGLSMSEFLTDLLIWIEQDLPHIKIESGILSIEAEEPFETIYNNIPVFIDTTGELMDLEGYEEATLVNKDKIIYKDKQTSSEVVFNFDKVKDLDLTPSFINKMKEGMYVKMIPLGIFFMYIYFSIVKLIHVFLFSLAGMLISNFKNKKFTYKEILNISIYSFSPVALLSVIFGLFQINNSVSWVTYTGLYAFYVVGAVFYTTKKNYIPA